MSLVDFDQARAAAAAATCRDASFELTMLTIRLAGVLRPTQMAGGARREADRVLGLLGTELRMASVDLRRTAEAIERAQTAAIATERRRREQAVCQPPAATMSQGGVVPDPPAPLRPAVRTSSTAGHASHATAGVR